LIPGLLTAVNNELSFIAPILIGSFWIKSKQLVFITGIFGTAVSAIIATLFLTDIKMKRKTDTKD